MADKGFWASVTSRLFLLIAVFALVAVGFGIVKGIIKRAEIEREIKSLQEEIGDNQKNVEQLSQLIEYLNTEEFKEKEARVQLGLQKPGETVVVIPTDDTELGPSDTLDKGSSQPSNFESWLNYLFSSK